MPARTSAEATRPAGRDGTKLVIVESPAKAKTIAGYLGPGLRRRGRASATSATCRDNAAEVPAEYKGEPWARLGVDVDHDFEPLYVVHADKKQQVSQAQAAAQGRRRALPRDRRGPRGRGDRLAPGGGAQARRSRSTGWSSTRSPRRRSSGAWPTRARSTTRLVDAQETRRILDRLYGYEVSPGAVEEGHAAAVGRPGAVGGDPAGRRARAGADGVPRRPSTGTSRRLVRRRRAEPATRATFTATLVAVDGARVATGPRLRPGTASSRPRADVLHLDEAGRAAAWPGAWPAPPFAVSSVEGKPYRRRPYAPFMTTTLQQEARRKLGFAAEAHDAVAQRLYENGFITYMRTDSMTLSRDRDHRGPRPGARAVRRRLRARRSRAPTPARSRTRRRRTRRSGRPATRFRTPGAGRAPLSGDEFRLYELIWKRTVASQMTDAVGHRSRSGSARRLDGRRARRVRRRPARSSPSRLPAGLRRGHRRPDAERDDRERRLPAAAPRATPLDAPRAGAPTATRPSRRPATPRRRWSRSWRSGRSAARRPTPRSSARSRTAATSSRRARRWCRPCWRSP